jgi:hypothetical protein
MKKSAKKSAVYFIMTKSGNTGKKNKNWLIGHDFLHYLLSCKNLGIKIRGTRLPLSGIHGSGKMPPWQT